jgi:hypothetical protein
MANCQSETINTPRQARTCAALMEVFHDAHDAYEAAVERGDADREAVTDARSEALVAFLAGPRPKNTVEAYQVIFAALQAVVDGNDFDLAWRSTVSPALTMMGVRGASDTAMSSIATDSLYNIGSDLEGTLGKLQALSAVFGRLADAEDNEALMFFSFMYSLNAIRDEANGVFRRVHARACAERRAVQEGR